MARIKRKTTTVVTRTPRRPYSRNFVDIYTRLTNSVQEQGATVIKARVGSTELLCGNSSSTSNPTPGILKTTRFRFQGSVTYFATGAPTRQFAKIGLLYIPEVERNMLANTTSVEGIGTYLQQALVNEPERLLAYKNVPLSQTNNGSVSVTISSKLSRNLKSGDGVYIFVMTGYNGDQALTSDILIRGEVTFYTKYN